MSVLELRSPAAERRPWLAPSLLGFLLLLAGCSQTWMGLDTGGGMGDMHLYQLYGYRMGRGLFPYRDFFFDWPPGSVLPVLLPGLHEHAYHDWFHALDVLYAASGIALAAATLVRLGVGGRRLYAAVVAMAALPVVLGSISINSFDYWPALFTGAALFALVRGRDRLGLALLGVGIVSKVYPVVLLPLALVWVARRRGRREALVGLALCSAVVALVAAPFAVLGFHGLWTTTVDQLQRGLQMESLGASVLMSLDHLGLVHVHTVVGKPYSLDVVGGGAAAVTTVSTLLVLAALACVYALYVRGRDEPQRLATAAAAAVVGWVAFNHVLSPQFLVWLFALVPLVAGTAGLLGTGLLLAACATTVAWFPARFWHLFAVGEVSWFVLLRNVLLVALFAVVLRPLRQCAARATV